MLVFSIAANKLMVYLKNQRNESGLRKARSLPGQLNLNGHGH